MLTLRESLKSQFNINKCIKIRKEKTVWSACGLCQPTLNSSYEVQIQIGLHLHPWSPFGIPLCRSHYSLSFIDWCRLCQKFKAVSWRKYDRWKEQKRNHDLQAGTWGRRRWIPDRPVPEEEGAEPSISASFFKSKVKVRNDRNLETSGSVCSAHRV